MTATVLQPQAPEQDWWGLSANGFPWLGEGPHPSPYLTGEPIRLWPSASSKDMGLPRPSLRRMWSLPDGDPSVNVTLLWGSDGLPIPAAARFSVSQSFGCGDLSTRCWFSKQDPIRALLPPLLSQASQGCMHAYVRMLHVCEGTDVHECARGKCEACYVGGAL